MAPSSLSPSTLDQVAKPAGLPAPYTLTPTFLPVCLLTSYPQPTVRASLYTVALPRSETVSHCHEASAQARRCLSPAVLQPWPALRPCAPRSTSVTGHFKYHFHQQGCSSLASEQPQAFPSCLLACPTRSPYHGLALVPVCVVCVHGTPEGGHSS